MNSSLMQIRLNQALCLEACSNGGFLQLSPETVSGAYLTSATMLAEWRLAYIEDKKTWPAELKNDIEFLEDRLDFKRLKEMATKVTGKKCTLFEPVAAGLTVLATSISAMC
jgi:hypothetical protein